MFGRKYLNMLFDEINGYEWNIVIWNMLIRMKFWEEIVSKIS